MKRNPERSGNAVETDRFELREIPPYRFALTRRGFLGSLGAGFVVVAALDSRLAQAGPDEAGPSIAARLHIGDDGIVTVFSSKVEVGQGSRTQLTQAAAEELRLPLDRVQLVLADTSRVPDDGGTYGSRTTGYTVPPVRQAAAAAREVLIDLARKHWRVDGSHRVELRDGKVVDLETGSSCTFAELAETPAAAEAFRASVPADIPLTPVRDWTVLGKGALKPTSRAVATGALKYPSDVVRPGMLRGSVLRPPSYGARLAAVDESAAAAIEGAVVVRDGDFVACAARTSFDARRAVAALAPTARWVESPHPSSTELFRWLKDNVDDSQEMRPSWTRTLGNGSVEEALSNASKSHQASYEVAYIHHAPMEPRAACAEWSSGGDSLTIWTGTQRPNGVREELQKVFELPEGKVTVIVPDTGGGFGGKHTGEVAVEAARLARAAGRPVSLRFTREEEFTWAYFRPSALVEARGGIDDQGAVSAWDFTCYNAGTSGLETPYEIGSIRERYLPVRAPLRQGSYRGLAATANHFARESFMDELAHIAAVDPLSFRLAHLKDERLRDVLQRAADAFRYRERLEQVRAGNGQRGVGLACGTEKGSYVAACVAVKIDRTRGKISVEDIVETYECGAIQNPVNLRAQVQGAIVMGLGGALKEEIRFENGRVTNPRFSMYQVPRTRDMVPMNIILMDRPDLPSVGAGETPIIAVAPAIGNAVFQATGVRIRSMPIRWAGSRAV
jgi:CO/xanthine dehydrogenase Mo-binding subunit